MKSSRAQQLQREYNEKPKENKFTFCRLMRELTILNVWHLRNNKAIIVEFRNYQHYTGLQFIDDQKNQVRTVLTKK